MPLSVMVAVVSMFPTVVVISSSTLLFLVTWNVLAVVPIVIHKIYAFVAGIVFAAVITPRPGVARRYAHIDRWSIPRSPFHSHRLTIKYAWLRIVVHVESAIESWLANIQWNPNVGSKY